MFDKKKDFKSKQQIARQFAFASTMGLQFFFTIGIPAYIGSKLDAKYHTDPYFTTGLAFFGIIAAFINFYQEVIKLNKK